MSYNFSQLKAELKKVEEWLAREYAGLHTGRATPVVLDTVFVDSYGSKMPVKNIASISIEDPKTLRVSPWDKNQVKEIEKAVNAVNLGLSVTVDKEGLRVIFPRLTEETRGSLVKVLKAKLEESRIRMRQEREKVWNDVQRVEKDGKMSEDDKFRAKDEIQKIIDAGGNALEDIFTKKES